MNKLVLSSYTWKGARRDIKKFVAECRMCQSKSLARPYGSAGIQQHFQSRKENILGRWALDHDVLSKTEKGNKHILTVMLIDADIVRLIAVPDQTAETTVKALWTHVVPLYGIPDSILADQGPAFISKLMKGMAELCGIKMIYTTTGNSRGNSLVERTHRTINEMLRAMIGEECDNNWDEKLPLVELTINATTNPRGEYCGHEKLYGQRVRLPGDHMRPELLKHAEEEQDESDYGKKIEYIRLLRQQASDETLRKRIESVDYQIRGKRFKTLAVGDRVLWHHQYRTETTPKLRLAYTGPYRIIKMSERNNLNIADIRHEETGKETTVNMRKLKLLQTRSEARTCLLTGCEREVEEGRYWKTGLPLRACCTDHWKKAVRGDQFMKNDKNQLRTTRKENKRLPTNNTQLKDKIIIGLPGDWMLAKIRQKYYAGVGLSYDDHRQEWTIQYVNTYGNAEGNSRYQRCWIDEKDGMEFFSNQPSRVTSKYRPLITNIKYNQIRGIIRDNEKGKLPKDWREMISGKSGVKIVRIGKVNSANKHTRVTSGRSLHTDNHQRRHRQPDTRTRGVCMRRQVVPTMSRRKDELWQPQTEKYWGSRSRRIISRPARRTYC
jgi:transposase InsO family protein